nr:hypothetical protein [Tanacetum cinerariifolium]
HPVDETTQLPDWFQKPSKPPTHDRAWNKTLPVVYGPIQPWISTLAWKEDPRDSFNGLMDTPLDFSAFVMNRLKVDTLTPELLVDPTFELIKGSYKSLMELEYFLEEVYKATTDQLDWNTLKGSNSAQAEEQVHMIKDLEEPAPQKFETSFTKDHPVDETTQLPDWFQKPSKPPTHDRAWNKTLPVVYGPIQL